MIALFVLCGLTRAARPRPFDSILAGPASLPVRYGAAIVNGDLWLSGAKVVRATRNGLETKVWNSPCSTFAPLDGACWCAQEFGDGRVHNLSNHSDRSFDLGANPVVCRCTETGDAICVAGARLWSLADPRPKELCRVDAPAEAVLLHATTPRAIAIAWRHSDTRVTVSLLTGHVWSRVAVRGSEPLALVRASNALAFALVVPSTGANMLDLYRIDVSARKATKISSLRRDYRQALAWDAESKSLYVNFSDGECTRVEALSTNGKVRWTSERFVEFATALCIDPVARMLYCVTRAGPIYRIRL